MKIFFLAALALGVLFSYSLRAEEPSPPGDENYRKAVEYLNKDDYDNAINALQKLLDKDPNQPKIYNALGLTYLKQNQSIESAIGSFEQAIRLDPKFAEAYFNLASTYASHTNEPAKAAEFFQKTIDIDPHFSRAYFGLGWFALTEKRDAKKALEYFKKTLELYPDFPEAQYGLGLTYLQLGKGYLMIETISNLRNLKRPDLASLLERASRGEISMDNNDPQESARENQKPQQEVAAKT